MLERLADAGVFFGVLSELGPGGEVGAEPGKGLFWETWHNRGATIIAAERPAVIEYFLLSLSACLPEALLCWRN